MNVIQHLRCLVSRLYIYNCMLPEMELVGAVIKQHSAIG